MVFLFSQGPTLPAHLLLVSGESPTAATEWALWWLPWAVASEPGPALEMVSLAGGLSQVSLLLTLTLVREQEPSHSGGSSEHPCQFPLRIPKHLELLPKLQPAACHCLSWELCAAGVLVQGQREPQGTPAPCSTSQAQSQAKTATLLSIFLASETHSRVMCRGFVKTAGEGLEETAPMIHELREPSLRVGFCRCSLCL